MTGRPRSLRVPTSASLLPPVIPYGAICLRESPHFRLNSDPQSRTLPDRIRNLLANSTRQLIRNVFEQTQPHGHLKQIFLEHGFVSVEFLDHAIVGYPPHPFWFWRQIPLVRVKAANRTKSRSDLCLALMRPSVTVHELRSISASRRMMISGRSRVSPI